MSSASFAHVNKPEVDKLAFDPKAFTLSARPKTDIYCSPNPPAVYVFSAPIVQQRLKRSAFCAARLGLSFNPSIQFDQAGIIFTIPSESNSSPNAGNSTVAESHPAWIKAGIEVNDGRAWLSVVARASNGWCDWSLSPLPRAVELPSTASVVIEMTRYKNALMIWMVEKERTLIRKVPWVFLDDSFEVIYVGAYAARPDPNVEASGKELGVEFRHLMIDTMN